MVFLPMGSLLGVPPSGLKLVFTTTGVDESITLPLAQYDEDTGAIPMVYDFTVDWGDTNSGEVTAYNDAERIHEYAVADTYIVTIKGTCDRFRFYWSADAEKLDEISDWGDIAFKDLAYAFAGCTNLVITATNAPDLSACADMLEAFEDCTSLTDSDGFENWDVSNITRLQGAFGDAASFNGDISGWDVSSVTDMYWAFAGTAFNRSLASWNVSNVIDMAQLFMNNSAFNGSLADWNTELVTDMGQMFYNASAFNQDISHFDVSSIIYSNNFMAGATAFSTANYDLLLNAWSLQSVPSSLNWDWDSTYTTATSQTARNILTAPSNYWNITDLGDTGVGVDAKEIEAIANSESYEKSRYWADNGTKVTFACFCRVPATNSGHDGFIIPTNSRGLTVRFTDWDNGEDDSSNRIDLLGIQVATIGYYGVSLGRATHGCMTGDWFALMGSIDYSASGVPPTVELWLQRRGDSTATSIKDPSPAFNQNGPVTMDFSYVTGGNTLQIGDSPQGNVDFDMCEIYIDGPDTAVDWSNSTERDKYVDSDGRPVGLGATGSDLTGSQPKIYAPDGDLTNNLGSEGNFTENGTIATISGP